ncbi:CHAT domain-containing protein [Gordonia alkaliphila]|uniref:CHAT domain-containing protein n=1 Tax=Gordonia alkaliphila TaxID=1053547 RepID=A0ABP8Z3H4_9ACTN
MIESAERRRRLLVRRCVRRYDLLISAHETENAIRTVLPHAVDNDDGLAQAAAIHLGLASSQDPLDTDIATRVENLCHAAAIALFADQIGGIMWYRRELVERQISTIQDVDISWRVSEQRLPTPAELYRYALVLLGHFDETTDFVQIVPYLERRIPALLSWVRACRLQFSVEPGWDDHIRNGLDRRLASGSGVEHYRFHFEYERLAAQCETGSIEDVSSYLAGAHAEFLRDTEGIMGETSLWVKVLLGRSFAEYLCGRIGEGVVVDVLTIDVPNTLEAGRRDSVGHVIHELNAALCAVDFAAELESPSPQTLSSLVTAAIDRIDWIMNRWRVLARSGGALSVVLKACLGDLAEVCAAHSEILAECGFRIALIVKRSTLTHLLRDPAVELPEIFREYLKNISIHDDNLWDAEGEERYAIEEERDRTIEEYELRISAALGPMVLELYDPGLLDVREVIARIASVEALDYVWVGRSARPLLTQWFRTHISRTGVVTFTGPYKSLKDAPVPLQTTDEWVREISPALLPPEMSSTADENQILLISPHAAHDGIPWPALRLDGEYLVENRTVSVVPCLANLADEELGSVTGPSVAHMVAAPIVRGDRTIGAGLDMGAELASWGYEPPPDVLVHTVQERAGEGSRRTDIDLLQLLRTRAKDYGFLHVSAHCGGTGLRQAIYLPQSLSVAQAFNVSWPPAVLLATCHSGEGMSGAEPLALCVAVMFGGARSVIAGVGPVISSGASYLVAAIVEAVRGGTVLTLPELLRDAQRAAIVGGLDPDEWGRLVAYVRGTGFAMKGER